MSMKFMVLICNTSKKVFLRQIFGDPVIYGVLILEKISIYGLIIIVDLSKCYNLLFDWREELLILMMYKLTGKNSGFNII